jgi:DNA invertase Pin-like site-specific DNA recombinase
MQLDALRAYALQRRWTVVAEVADIGSGSTERTLRAELLNSARRRHLDAILVWRLDRWGRSMADLVLTLQELHSLGVGFISLTEALDFNTPSGRAMAGLLAVFAEFEREILRDRVRAGIAHARLLGKPHGRPATVRAQADEIRRLASSGCSQAAIARRLGVGRTSVRRVLACSA